MAERANIIKILLVEDSVDDIAITKRALKAANIVNRLWVVRDGKEALDFLSNKGQYEDPMSAPIPGLILLDINLPKLNGLGVLKEIKSDNRLKHIPVVMLTVSRREEDILEGYNLGCNSFIQKPVEFEKFVEVVAQIGLYWGVLNIESPE